MLKWVMSAVSPLPGGADRRRWRLRAEARVRPRPRKVLVPPSRPGPAAVGAARAPIGARGCDGPSRPAWGGGARPRGRGARPAWPRPSRRGEPPAGPAGAGAERGNVSGKESAATQGRRGEAPPGAAAECAAAADSYRMRRLRMGTGGGGLGEGPAAPARRYTAAPRLPAPASEVPPPGRVTVLAGQSGRTAMALPGPSRTVRDWGLPPVGGGACSEPPV